MAAWEPVPQSELRPVSRWSEDNDTPEYGTHAQAAYVPPYRLLERLRSRDLPSFRSPRGSQHKNKGTAREALGDFLRRNRGWRAGIVLCVLACALVFALNAVTTVISVLRVGQSGGGGGGSEDNDAQQQQQTAGVNNQVVTFYQGGCATTRTLSLVLRAVINILATILLGCSNYCMQILVSPQRSEIDLAHQRKRWLRIGVPNFRNLPYIGVHRAAICIVLMLSALPLHLLWNAALVETIGANDYYVGGVTEDFFSSSDGNSSASPENFVAGWFQGSQESFKDVWFPAIRGSDAVNLTAEDCIRAYGTPATRLYGSVALVFRTRNETNPFLFAGTHLIGAGDKEDGGAVGLGNSWVCGLPAPSSSACNYRSLADNNSTSWTPLSRAAGWSTLKSSHPDLEGLARSNVPVKYCMAQQTTTDGSPSSPCQLATLPILQYAVLGANGLMLICFVATWLSVRRGAKHEGGERIVTNGDLVASYLREPDMRFAGRCLASAHLVAKAKRHHRGGAEEEGGGGRGLRRRRPSATTHAAQVNGSDEKRQQENEEEGEEDTTVGFWNSSQPMPLPWTGRPRFALEDDDAAGAAAAGFRKSRLGCFGQQANEEERTTGIAEQSSRKSAPRWHTGAPGLALRLLLPAILVLGAILGLFFGFRLHQNLFPEGGGGGGGGGGIGFGQPSTQAMAGVVPPAAARQLHGDGDGWGVAATALVANVPQLAAIYVYLACNAALTAMLAHAEVSRFAVRRTALRVSVPRPDAAHRSTLHLHLPLKVSLPLLGACAALHWLAGESLFLLHVAAYNGGLLHLHPQDGGGDGGSSSPTPRAVMTAVGYSALPILAAVGLLALLVGIVLAVSWFRRYMGAERMPLFATCSASLAAATCPTSSFYFPQVVVAGGGEGGEPKPAPQRRSHVGSWVEAVGLTASAPAVGMARGHPSRDEIDIVASPPLQEGSYAYYKMRRFEEKLSEHGLAWGTVEDSDPVHHATFSLGPVLPLEKGQFYA